MRIVWKDSNGRVYAPVKYRKHIIKHIHEGWIISTMPEERRIFATIDCAMNGLDQRLGRNAHGVSKRRLKKGIRTGGVLNDESA